ncbi:MAG: hypothetical protein ABH950_05635 [Candidatus Altiarchaeota archaeon]
MNPQPEPKSKAIKSVSHIPSRDDALEDLKDVHVPRFFWRRKLRRERNFLREIHSQLPRDREELDALSENEDNGWPVLQRKLLKAGQKNKISPEDFMFTIETLKYLAEDGMPALELREMVWKSRNLGDLEYAADIIEKVQKGDIKLGDGTSRMARKLKREERHAYSLKSLAKRLQSAGERREGAQIVMGVSIALCVAAGTLVYSQDIIDWITNLGKTQEQTTQQHQPPPNIHQDQPHSSTHQDQHHPSTHPNSAREDVIYQVVQQFKEGNDFNSTELERRYNGSNPELYDLVGRVAAKKAKDIGRAGLWHIIDPIGANRILRLYALSHLDQSEDGAINGVIKNLHSRKEIEEILGNANQARGTLLDVAIQLNKIRKPPRRTPDATSAFPGFNPDELIDLPISQKISRQQLPDQRKNIKRKVGHRRRI